MTADEIRAAVGRMTPPERAFVRKLLPSEQRVFLEIFHYFPQAKMLDEGPVEVSHPPDQATLDL